MNRDYLTINADGQLVFEQDGAKHRITSYYQLSKLARDDGFLCSSSIDFPEEYTSDPTVIAICKAL